MGHQFGQDRERLRSLTGDRFVLVRIASLALFLLGCSDMSEVAFAGEHAVAPDGLPVDPGIFVAVQLECPTKPKPRLILHSRNRDRQYERIVIGYENERAMTIRVATAEPDGILAEFFVFDEDIGDDDESVQFAAAVLKRIQPYSEACRAGGKKLAALKADIANTVARLEAFWR